MSKPNQSLNKCPEVVTKPTPYKGGLNTPPVVVTNPTRYTGGLNKEVCNVPKNK